MSTKIDAKQAVRIATTTLEELYPAEQLPDLALEEVELVDGGGFWDVTLSVTSQGYKTPIEAMTVQAGARAYKVVRIDAEGGDVHSMKNRLV